MEPHKETSVSTTMTRRDFIATLGAMALTATFSSVAGVFGAKKGSRPAGNATLAAHSNSYGHKISPKS